MGILRYKTKVFTNWDKDAKNFIDATGLDNDANLDVEGLYTTEQARRAINIYIKALKSIKDTGQTQNVWEKSIAEYLVLGGTEDIAKINTKDPRDLDEAFRLVFHGGMSLVNGIKGDGIGLNDKYADTLIIPNDEMIAGNNHIMFYKGDNIIGDYRDIGCSDAGITNGVTTYFNATYANGWILGNLQTCYEGGGTTGTYIMNCLSNRIRFFNKRNRVFDTAYTQSALPSTKTLTIGKVNVVSGNLYYSPTNFRHISFGKGLTDLEAIQKSYAVEVFNASINRSYRNV